MNMLWTEYNALAIRLAYALSALRIENVTWNVQQIDWCEDAPLAEQTQQFNVRATYERDGKVRMALIAIGSTSVKFDFAASVQRIASAGCERLNGVGAPTAVVVL